MNPYIPSSTFHHHGCSAQMWGRVLVRSALRRSQLKDELKLRTGTCWSISAWAVWIECRNRTHFFFAVCCASPDAVAPPGLPRSTPDDPDAALPPVYPTRSSSSSTSCAWQDPAFQSSSPGWSHQHQWAGYPFQAGIWSRNDFSVYRVRVRGIQVLPSRFRRVWWYQAVGCSSSCPRQTQGMGRGGSMLRSPLWNTSCKNSFQRWLLAGNVSFVACCFFVNPK